tara:strand:+ start:3843 stop:4061 length:219 start_codon:yes stop_codon:yes gene_type:complete
MWSEVLLSVIGIITVVPAATWGFVKVCEWKTVKDVVELEKMLKEKEQITDDERMLLAEVKDFLEKVEKTKIK